MATLPVQFNTRNQLMALETCLHAVVQRGFTGLKTVEEALTTELAHLLDAHITILHDAPQFVLIIHNHREKLAILGHIEPCRQHHYDITLDGHTVNNGPELMRVIYAYL